MTLHCKNTLIVLRYTYIMFINEESVLIIHLPICLYVIMHLRINSHEKIHTIYLFKFSHGITVS